jgi:hypothetical protein
MTIANGTTRSRRVRGGRSLFGVAIPASTKRREASFPGGFKLLTPSPLVGKSWSQTLSSPPRAPQEEEHNAEQGEHRRQRDEQDATDEGYEKPESEPHSDAPRRPRLPTHLTLAGAPAGYMESGTGGGRRASAFGVAHTRLTQPRPGDDNPCHDG